MTSHRPLQQVSPTTDHADGRGRRQPTPPFLLSITIPSSFILLLVLCCFIVAVEPSEATTFAQIGDPIRDDSETTSFFGSSVSLSAGPEAVVAVIGTPGRSGGVGGAQIYQRISSSQAFSLAKTLNMADGGTYTNGSPRLGASTAISGNGNVVVLGGPGDNNETGTVLIFSKTFQTASTIFFDQRLTPPPTSPKSFGTALATSNDGSVIVIGAPGDENTPGGIYIYVKSGASWARQGNLVNGTDFGPDANQGLAVACNGDASVIVFGGPSENGGDGAAWALTRDVQTGTITKNQKLGVGALPGAQFGVSVAVTANGNLILVPEPAYATIRVFSRLSAAADFVARPLVLTLFPRAFGIGSSMHLTPDGRIATLGAPFATLDTGGAGRLVGDGTGSFTAANNLHVFTPFSADGATFVGSLQGASVSCNSDASVCAVGAPYDNDGDGAVYFAGFGSQSNPLEMFQIIQIVAGCVGGSLVLCLCIGVCRAQYRLRQSKKEGMRVAGDGSILDISGAVRNPTHWNRAFVKGLVQKSLTHRVKRYAVFISYHQAAASGDANAIYEQLINIGFLPEHIFFDKTSLSSITELTSAVKISALVLQLQTPSLYQRPYCLIEAYTALRSGVQIVPINLDSYDFRETIRINSSPDPCAELDRINPGIAEEIQRNGLDPSEVVKAVLGEATRTISFPYKSSERKMVRDAMFAEIAQVILNKLQAPFAPASSSFMSSSPSSSISSSSNKWNVSAPPNPAASHQGGAGVMLAVKVPDYTDV